MFLFLAVGAVGFVFFLVAGRGAVGCGQVRKSTEKRYFGVEKENPVFSATLIGKHYSLYGKRESRLAVETWVSLTCPWGTSTSRNLCS